MLRQPLVDERVVRRQQIHHVAIFLHHALEEQLGLALEGLPQVVVEIRERGFVRQHALHVAQEQPLLGEIIHQRFGFRIGQHAPHFAIQHRRIFQLALRRHVQQLIVGNAAPQEKRKPRRQIQIAHVIEAAGRHARRIGLGAEQELRARKDQPQRVLDPGFKVPP